MLLGSCFAENMGKKFDYFKQLTPAQIVEDREQGLNYLLGKNNVPVGSGSPKNNNVRVSGFAKKWVGDYENADPDGKASEILSSVCDEKTWLITGAALTNIFW
jgi:hypothetical protein